MIEILVFETSEKAEKALRKYELHNREAYEGFVKSQGEEPFQRLARQYYFFVAELAAYTDTIGGYFSESTLFPFLGGTDIYDDIASVVEGVKEAICRQTPKNIEAIFYTVNGHVQENQELDEIWEEGRKVAESLPLEKKYGMNKKDVGEFLQFFEQLKETQVRGLTERERDEFVRIYEK